MNFRGLAKIATAALGLGLLASACSSTSTTSNAANAAPASSPPAIAPYVGQLHGGTQIASTVPADGDVNPYGVAVVPGSEGRLVAGGILVSNFNDKANVQGTGTTIVQVSPGGQASLFADITALPAGMSCPGGVGLTTALGILPGGWVVVGSLPTATSAELFVSNALGGNTSTEHGVPVTGNCTVVRLDLSLSPSAPPQLTSSTVIGSGYPWRANKAALVLAPTGLALSRSGTLYVADTLTNSISAIPHALTRGNALQDVAATISIGGALNAPLGMALAPNGDLVVVNGNNGNAVEITPQGRQLATKTLVRNGAGDLFGIITTSEGNLLAVNDGTNALEEFRFRG